MRKYLSEDEIAQYPPRQRRRIRQRGGYVRVPVPVPVSPTDMLATHIGYDHLWQEMHAFVSRACVRQHFRVNKMDHAMELGDLIGECVVRCLEHRHDTRATSADWFKGLCFNHLRNRRRVCQGRDIHHDYSLPIVDLAVIRGKVVPLRDDDTAMDQAYVTHTVSRRREPLRF